jgi:hypothetical protein
MGRVMSNHENIGIARTGIDYHIGRSYLCIWQSMQKTKQQINVPRSIKAEKIKFKEKFKISQQNQRKQCRFGIRMFSLQDKFALCLAI